MTSVPVVVVVAQRQAGEETYRWLERMSEARRDGEWTQIAVVCRAHHRPVRGSVVAKVSGVVLCEECGEVTWEEMLEAHGLQLRRTGVDWDDASGRRVVG